MINILLQVVLFRILPLLPIQSFCEGSVHFYPFSEVTRPNSLIQYEACFMPSAAEGECPLPSEPKHQVFDLEDESLAYINYIEAS